MTAPVPAAGIVEAAVEALMRSYVVPDNFTATKDARIVLAVVLPMVADEIEALRQRHFTEYGADETGPRNYNWALTHADRLVRSLAEGLGDE